MKRISFQKELIEKIPSIRLGFIQCHVEVLPGEDKIKELSKEIITPIAFHQL